MVSAESPLPGLQPSHCAFSMAEREKPSSLACLLRATMMVSDQGPTLMTSLALITFERVKVKGVKARHRSFGGTQSVHNN